MLGNTKPFSSFSVDDLHKAKEFYAETFGVEVKTEAEGLELAETHNVTQVRKWWQQHDKTD